METGELSIHTFNDYKRTCDLLVSTFGKQRLITDLRPDDFAAMRKTMAKKWGLQRIAKAIQFVRCVLRNGSSLQRFAPRKIAPARSSEPMACNRAYPRCAPHSGIKPTWYEIRNKCCYLFGKASSKLWISATLSVMPSSAYRACDTVQASRARSNSPRA
jgi:hypothetical protein